MTQQDDIRSTITSIYDALVNVTVVTTVGGVTAKLASQGDDEKLKVTITTDDTAKSFVTQVNLVEGDVVASVPAGVEEMPAALAMHEQHVEQALTVLPANIAALVDAGREIIALLDASS